MNTNRRGFFQQLASGLVVMAAPTVFVPRLIAPRWKPERVARAGFGWREYHAELMLGWDELGYKDAAHFMRCTEIWADHPDTLVGSLRRQILDSTPDNVRLTENGFVAR